MTRKVKVHDDIVVRNMYNTAIIAMNICTTISMINSSYSMFCVSLYVFYFYKRITAIIL
jgi:hypothetical protein